MEQRDIFNYLNEKIGVLEMPDGTTEEVWSAELAKYAVTPESNVPTQISARQIRLALFLSGITLQMIDESLATLPEPTKTLAQISWEYSNFFLRSDPLADQVASMLGWTSEQTDQLWILGNSL
jgi:hypothetical protein